MNKSTSKIECLRELKKIYPKWEECMNSALLDAQIHGWKFSKEDAELANRFGQIMKDLGVKT